MSRRWWSLLAVPVVIVAAGTALTAGAAPAAKTQECKGLKVCVPVAGPWVVVPGGLGVPRTPVVFDLSCPKGYQVGGLDAELSDRAIDVSFQAKLGSPVNPGISTSRDAVFTALYVGSTQRGAPTFRPHIGCMPGNGGGGRIQTVVKFKVGQPTQRHVTIARLLPGVRAVSATCGPKQRLVAGSVALAFGGLTPPSASTVGTLRATKRLAGRSVIATARVADAALGTRPFVQALAVCAVVQ